MLVVAALRFTDGGTWDLSEIHSFIPAISIALLQVIIYSEALPTTARILSIGVSMHPYYVSLQIAYVGMYILYRGPIVCMYSTHVCLHSAYVCLYGTHAI